MPSQPTIEPYTDHHANYMRPSRRKKSSVFWSKASSGSSLYLFFLFAPVGGPLLFLILKNRPQLPTPRNALTKATVLYIGGFFFSSTAKDPASSQPFPPSCPSLRTLQCQRDWRKKESKNELYTPPYSYKDAVLDSAGGRERVLYDAACAC